MNIAILSYHRIGGSGIVAYEIGRAMAEERGHNVHFIGLEPPFRLKDSYIEKMKFHKVWVKEYPVFDFQPYALALASQLADIIVRNNIDVIHSHYALPHAVSALLARDISGRNVKCVTTLHGTDITVVGAHPTMMNITKYAIERSDAVTAVSDSLIKNSEDKLGIEKGRIKCIHNFVNTDFFNPGLKTDIAKEMDKRIIMHVSNLRPVKSPNDVIRIFNEIEKEMPDEIELWIVGEGPLQYEMVSLTEELNIRDKVRFIGICSNLGGLIASSDLMILPSREESFGLVALEAMACGVPVLASSVGGLPEVIEDGVSGFLFEHGNVDEASEKGLRILKDKNYYDRVVQEGINTANEKFSREKIVSKYEEIYKST
ncbi:MAG: N-acetyl-alpha-D-glucosaminyl L-malate synthase BshA [Acidobacteriota bacterium]